MKHGTRSFAALTGGLVLLGLVAPASSAVPAASPRPLPRAGGAVHHASSASVARASRPVTRLIVKTTDGRPLSPAGLVAAGRVAGAPTTPAARALSRGQSLVYLGTALTTAEAWSAARALQARADVVWAEPDLPVYASDVSPVTPNDPLFAQEWDAWDTTPASGGYSTRVPATWNRTKGDPSVVVAVLDTGLTVHPDLSSSVVAPTASDPTVKGYDFVSGDPDNSGSTFYVANDGNGRDADPSDPGDWITASDAAGNTAGGLFLNCFADTSSWHGTHVTGTIVAKQNNGEGISGLAPGVKVQPVRVLGRCGGYSSDINDAIEWASGGHVDGVPDNATPASVINMSLGGPGLCLASTQAAITDARNRGTTVVVAAGNEGASIDPNVAGGGSQPADCAGVVRVAATTRTGGIAALYSNYGDDSFPITVAAPGGSGQGGSEDILSTVNPGTSVPVLASSVVPAKRYAAYAGTSMATPHVAAAVALLQSTRAGRTPYQPVEVENWLTTHVLAGTPTSGPSGLTCTPARCGAGIIDLSALPTEAPLVPTVTVEPGDASLSASWTPGDPGGLPVTYSVDTRDITAAGGWVNQAAATSATSLAVSGLVDGDLYEVRVIATNSVGSAPEVVTTPVRVSAYASVAPAATGGVERISVTWQAPVAPPTEVTGYALRYRLHGATDWIQQAAGATATGAVLTTWPTSMPAGQYDVELAALHDAVTIDTVATDGHWSRTLSATVVALVNRVTLSATTMRPFRDGFQDYVVVRVATNRPGGATGTLRILNAAKTAVLVVPLKAGSAWTYVWKGLNARGLRVPNGRYYAQVYLPGTTSSLTPLATAPSMVVAASQALKPTISMSSTSLFPFVDGYRDSTRIITSATVPSVMTWRVVRAKKTYWQASFTRRTTASLGYAARTAARTPLPAGTYALYVYAKAGEGKTVVSAKTFVVSAKRAVKRAFAVDYNAFDAAYARFTSLPGNDASSPDGVQVLLPPQTAVTFLGGLPSSVLPLASVQVTIHTAYTAFSPVIAQGFYGGAGDQPNVIRPVPVTSFWFVSPVAPSVSYLGGALRWYVENDSTSTGDWDIQSFTLTGYRWVLV